MSARRLVIAAVVTVNAMIWPAVAAEAVTVATYGCANPGHGMVNACAPLDTSNIIDSRTPGAV